MRLWSIHPKYLDPQGLVALWREALLAQKVLCGKTRGYKNHPQLERFKKERRPREVLAAYLSFVLKEAKSRGYDFDRRKIGPRRVRKKMRVTKGQLRYEFLWLCRKLKKRSPECYRAIRGQKNILPHPLFLRQKGAVEWWERVK